MGHGRQEVQSRVCRELLQSILRRQDVDLIHEANGKYNVSSINGLSHKITNQSNVFTNLTENSGLPFMTLPSFRATGQVEDHRLIRQLKPGATILPEDKVLKSSS